VETLGGNAKLAESILLISSLISIVTAPLLLKFYEMISGLHLDVTFSHIIRQFAVAQFIPIVLSVTLRYFFPKLLNISKYIIRGASLLLFICFMIIIWQKQAAFGEFRINGYVAIIIITASAFILGTLIAGKNPKNQIALAIESAMRNPGLAFLIAAENFAAERVNLAIVPLLVTMAGTIIVCTLLLKLLQKHWQWV
jgi:predicted Na+-dependent transporter